MVFAADSGHTGPSHLPQPTGTAQTDPIISRQQVGQHRPSPAAVIMPSPSTFSLRLLLHLFVFQQLWLRLATALGKAVPALCPELGITSATFLWLQAADREAFLWLPPPVTQHKSIKTPGQQQLFPGRYSRQQFHTLHTPYPSEVLFLAPHCIYSGCNILWCNIQLAFKTHFSIYCQVEC